MITKLLSQKLVLLVIGLAAGSGILIPASYGSFHPVTSSEIQDGTIQSIDIGDGQVKTVDIGFGAVTNGKLANGAVNSAKIADNSIIAADIAADAVGASEIAGVSKLIFNHCPFSSSTALLPGMGIVKVCEVPGASTADRVIATNSGSGNSCFAVTKAKVVMADIVHVTLRNTCTTEQSVGTATLAIIVFHPGKVFS